MTDSEFISWIHERLEHQHGESPNVDYMLRLKEIATAKVEQQKKVKGLTLPGMQVLNRWITDACKQMHSDPLQVVIDELRKKYAECEEGWKEVPGVEYHFGMTIKRPEQEPSDD